MGERSAVAVRANAAERWLTVVAWGVLVVGGLLLVTGHDRFVPPCAFRTLTGRFCPGCGSGRALVALYRFDIPAALRANALVVGALPFTVAALVLETASTWGLAAPRVRAWRHLPTAALFVIIAFWVLRNLSGWPWELLAPH